MKYPTSILNLIESFKKLPGIGEKTAERLALSVLDMSDESVSFFSNSILDVKNKIKRCIKCNNLSENDLCEVCKDESRDHSVLCVVELPRDVILFEKLHIYMGVYHVLDGLISPIDGKNPEDINISQLIDRVKKENIKEVILALKPSIEGETTSLYITKLLEKTDVTITRIAHGIPHGADMDYVDSLTLELALENRMIVSSKES